MQFHLGNTAHTKLFSKPIQLDRPSVVQIVGAIGSGRGQFLTEIAGQAIRAGAGVIYIDWLSGVEAWADIYTAAEGVGRQAQCYAKISDHDDLADVSMDAIVKDGAVLWCGPGALSNPLPKCGSEATALIMDLSHALTAREDRTRPFVVILDGIVGGLQGVPDSLKPVIGKAAELNVTLVFTDRDEHAHYHDDHVAAHATCRVFMKTISESGHETFRRLFGREDDLRDLEAGEAFVAVGAPAAQTIEHARLAWSCTPRSGHVRPANSTRPLAQ